MRIVERVCQEIFQPICLDRYRLLLLNRVCFRSCARSQYIASPALSARGGTMDVDSIHIKLLCWIAVLKAVITGTKSHSSELPKQIHLAISTEKTLGN